MDFVVVLDSSSSVRAENWMKMKKFVRSFLSEFVVRPDSSQFAVIRYNREVDTDTQILLNSFPDSTQAVLEKFDEIPYDGSGTRTGNALNYVANTLLRIGNRPIANDVVLLITDGASQDDIVAPSKRIRDQALFYVLPVKPPQGNLNMTEIEVMAGEDQYVLRDAVEGGFDALDVNFSRKMLALLCGNPCRNPLHDHE
uniref:P-selectin-like n=1 Tax=Phallusia mammillata TaxID=59560 RepID=A0A6F9DSG6_9ASCI|nr:P-selectin-like [Phallusia mammillata]